MTSNMSILGLYNYDPQLFSLINLPAEFTAADSATLVNNLVADLAELEVLYPSPTFMKTMIGVWSAKELPTWERVYAASKAEYNPIENYDRIEETTDEGGNTRTHSGQDVSYSRTDDDTTHSGSDISTNSGTDVTTNKVAGFDSNSLVNHDSSDLQHGHVNTLAHGETINNDMTTNSSLTHGEVITDESGNTHNSRIHGNIGVTTSQQMLEQELEVSPKLNVINYIIESFKNRFCLLVY